MPASEIPLSGMFGLVWSVLKAVATLIWQVLLTKTSGGSRYRKHGHDTFGTLVREVMRQKMILGPFMENYVVYASISTLLKVMAWIHPAFIKKHWTPVDGNQIGFNEKFDGNSVWMVRHTTKDGKTDKSVPVLIYFHGGGYLMQAGPPMLDLMGVIHSLLTQKMSILLFDYDLITEGHPLPRQQEQVVQTYLRLVNEGFSKIHFMGDSAGGHLAITSLQHFKALETAVPYPVSLVLISPWTKLTAHSSEQRSGTSYYENRDRDCIPFNLLANPSMHRLLLSPLYSFSSVSISPGNAPRDTRDWDTIPTLSKVFVLAGEDELFRDDILNWCHYALGVPLFKEHTYGDSNGVYDPSKHSYVSRSNGGHVEVHIEPWGSHDSIFVSESPIMFSKKPYTLEKLDREYYFGLTRIVDFLNSNS
ncbi:hypothetical protein DICA3_A07316 [Diutina catenulata]